MKNCLLSVAVALLAGTAGAAVVSDQLDTAYQNLQAAESSKDAARIKKAAVDAYGLADQEIRQGAPADSEDKKAWTDRVAFDRDVETHAEYALYSSAVAGSPQVALDLFAALEQLNPKSKYIDSGCGYYFKLLEQSGQKASVTAAADRVLTSFPNNPEALLVVSESALTRKQTDRALTCAKRLVMSLKSRPKPEGVPESQWESTKAAMLGRGCWIAGFIEGQKNEYYDANNDLRTALPLIQTNESMAAPALFYLGVANYNLSREMLNKAQMKEAISFSERAAAIKSPYSQKAWENAMVMKAELAKWR
jgi:hypothetical protein